MLTDYPRDPCLHELFEAQAARTPQATAVAFQGEALTYQELNRRANQWAHHLREVGVGPEVRVGICVERSLEMVVGLLGILKAGGAYVPLDPSSPRERLALMQEALGQPPVLLTQERFRSALPAAGAHVLCLDGGGEAISRQSEGNPASGVMADNLAYVIHTSGSTGQPKGVMIAHRGVCNYLFWRQSYFPLTAADRLLQKAPISFDDSVWELFEPLMVGARLVLARPGGERDSRYLAQLIAEQKITAASFVPSMLESFLEEETVAQCHSLRRVTTGGETLRGELQERFFARLAADLHNGYGPTEATIAATFWTCRRGSSERVIPIGRPVANTQVYLLDSHLHPVPMGEPGELHIGGDGLARGYLDRPELTAEKFIPHPFSDTPGARLYKTGDLARCLPDGNLEFLGRMDHQVKVRGFRIELGEIETVLRQHPGVREAVVLAREDEPGQKRLVAYVVPDPERAVSTGELRRFLRERLPDYMHPSFFVTLESVPLTSSGKLDRHALPAPHPARPELCGACVAPRFPVEEAVAAIWEPLLGVQPVGVEDNFFELGGDSLLAAQVISRLRRDLRVELPLRCLFDAPTVAGLAIEITRSLAAQAEPGEMAKLLADLEEAG